MEHWAWRDREGQRADLPITQAPGSVLCPSLNLARAQYSSSLGGVIPILWARMGMQGRGELMELEFQSYSV